LNLILQGDLGRLLSFVDNSFASFVQNKALISLFCQHSSDAFSLFI